MIYFLESMLIFNTKQHYITSIGQSYDWRKVASAQGQVESIQVS